MLLKIPDLLNAEELEAVCAELRRGNFVEGKLSAGANAKNVKNNREFDANAENYTALNNVVMSRLVQHPSYLQAAMPAKICAPIYARYTRGMSYGRHLDDPIMGPAQARYRADIAISIFLNAPSEYDGGELRIETTDGDQDFKLPAGHALLYPATSYHSVLAVSAGERLVAVTWVQSLIRRVDQREILLQLDRARQSLASDSGADTRQQLDLCYANLFRLWAEL